MQIFQITLVIALIVYLFEALDDPTFRTIDQSVNAYVAKFVVSIAMHLNLYKEGQTGL